MELISLLGITKNLVVLSPKTEREYQSGIYKHLDDAQESLLNFGKETNVNENLIVSFDSDSETFVFDVYFNECVPECKVFKCRPDNVVTKK